MIGAIKRRASLGTPRESERTSASSQNDGDDSRRSSRRPSGLFEELRRPSSSRLSGRRASEPAPQPNLLQGEWRGYVEKLPVSSLKGSWKRRFVVLDHGRILWFADEAKSQNLFIDKAAKGLLVLTRDFTCELHAGVLTICVGLQPSVVDTSTGARSNRLGGSAHFVKLRACKPDDQAQAGENGTLQELAGLLEKQKGVYESASAFQEEYMQMLFEDPLGGGPQNRLNALPEGSMSLHSGPGQPPPPSWDSTGLCALCAKCLQPKPAKAVPLIVPGGPRRPSSRDRSHSEALVGSPREEPTRRLSSSERRRSHTGPSH